MVGRAAVNSSENGANFSYFFHGSKYVKISWVPNVDNDKVVHGPKEFVNDWESLVKARFASGQIDAILPCPGESWAYFFSETEWAAITFKAPGFSKQEVFSTGSMATWASLRKAGFERVDAVLVVPGTTDQAYFFRGREFVRVYFQNLATKPDPLLDGPHLIRERWSKLGFDTIDTIIPSPTSTDEAYVFSDNLGARIKLVPGGGVDVLVGPIEAATYWKSLHKAGFY